MSNLHSVCLGSMQHFLCRTCHVGAVGVLSKMHLQQTGRGSLMDCTA